MHSIRVREWALKLGLVALVMFWLGVIAVSWADAAERRSTDLTDDPLHDASETQETGVPEKGKTDRAVAQESVPPQAPAAPEVSDTRTELEPRADDIEDGDNGSAAAAAPARKSRQKAQKKKRAKTAPPQSPPDEEARATTEEMDRSPASAPASASTPVPASAPRAQRAHASRRAPASDREVAHETTADRAPASMRRPAETDGLSTSDSEYNFNWLDPDKKIYVLQNRKYEKVHHAILSLMAGPGLSSPYRNALNISGRAAYYVTETFGFEPFYVMGLNTENNTFEALKKASGNTPIPVVREIRSEYGLLLHYTPWYAKINFFNEIIYFDWYLAGGGGNLHTAVDTRSTANAAASYKEEDLFGIFLGTGHMYHLSQRFLVRLDFTGAFYRAPIYGTQGGDSVWFTNYTFGLGFGLKL